MKPDRKNLICSLIILFFSGVVYFITLAPTLSWTDSGELAAVCSTLGVAHPTGYPLYILLGRLFSSFPYEQPIRNLILMSAFWAALTNLVLFFSFLLLSGIFFKEKLNSRFKLSAAILITLLFSFSSILWSQAVINEVYSLNIFLCSMIIFSALYWFKRNNESSDSEPVSLRLICFLTFLLGLSSGNHLLSILLIPALLFLVISSASRKILSLKTLILALIFLILGVSIYLYLPIRASLNPALNWGNPSNLLNLKNHLDARIYRTRMFFESTLMFFGNLKYFAGTFFRQFPAWALPFILLGIFKMLRQSLKLFIFLILIILFNLAWCLNYSIKDIDPYFLQTILVSSYFLYIGMLFFLELAGKVWDYFKLSNRIKPLFNLGIILILTIFYFSRFLQEFKAQNRSKNYIPYDFSLNILRSSYENAVVLTEVWDYYSPWLYLRYVENKRPDLEMVQTDLLQWTWYKDYMQRYYPGLYKRSAQGIERFDQYALRMEKNEPVNLQEVSLIFSQVVDSLILKNMSDRPIYITFLDAYKGYTGLPTTTEGLLMRFRPERKFYPYEFPDFHLRGISSEEFPKTNKELACIAHYAVAYYNRALYLRFFDLTEEADRYFQKAYYFKELFSKQAPNIKFQYF
ncbi:MAG TPA: DUF2723 domain-containing protein [Terriglobales bacterium]|nr:DUF2723 domain-containing protein [Terriglobales bacterium]